MIPITKPFIGEEEKKAIVSVIESGWLVQGEKVNEFEKRIAVHEGVQYCCATTSCTSALHIAMLSEGMCSNMDVIVPSFTFVATANAVTATGATPIIVDVDPYTYNLSAEKVEKYIDDHYVVRDDKVVNSTTGNILWGIVPVHQFGLCADMLRLNRIAHKYKLKIIEDAACALGSKIEETHIGGFGNTACISFHPRKSITTGEGGMILTNDLTVYERAIELRNHGSAINSSERHNNMGNLLPSYVINGYNYRMTDIQGALGCEQVKRLDNILGVRRDKAHYYDKLLSNKSEVIKIPFVPEGYYHTYQSYVCRLDFSDNSLSCGLKRNEVMKGLNEFGIATRQGTHAVHKLEYYQTKYGYCDGDLPVADMCDMCTISLPLFVTMTDYEQQYVVEKLLEFVEK